MKVMVGPLLIAMLLTRCGAGPVGNGRGPLDAPSVAPVTPPPDLLEAMVGQWMPTEYCDCLIKQRSAFACQATMDDIYTLFVERSGPDSLRWSYITTHEGGPEAILGYDAANSSFVHHPSEEDYLGYEMLRLRSIDANNLEFLNDPGQAPQRFRRIVSADAVLNDALFTGTYVLEGDTAVVRFGTDGSVSGLPGISQYSVLTDFTEGLDDRDIVFLFEGDYDWGTDAFHYQHLGQELLLYPMVSTEEQYVYRMEQVKYRLLPIPD